MLGLRLIVLGSDPFTYTVHNTSLSLTHELSYHSMNVNTTFNNGSLGSRIDEERSEMR